MNQQKKLSAEEAHKHFGVAYNNMVWEFLGKEDRTATESDEMIHAAHASHIHWLVVGNETNQQRGNWMLARVYSELGLADRALHYAGLCRELTAAHPDKMEQFDLAYSFEAVARASAVAGDTAAATKYYAQAREAGSKLAGEDLKYFEGDLASGNWGSFTAP